MHLRLKEQKLRRFWVAVVILAALSIALVLFGSTVPDHTNIGSAVLEFLLAASYVMAMTVWQNGKAACKEEDK